MRSEDEIKSDLFENQFAMNILELTIDKQSFTELCELLKELAAVWKDKAEVDKETIRFITEILMIAHNKLYFGGFDHEDEAALVDMQTEIQTLYFEQCLI